MPIPSTPKVKSAKTTTAGWIVMVAAILMVVGKVMSGEPLDIEGILQILGIGGIGVGGFVTGLFARDENVSSEGRKIPKDNN